MKAGINIYNKWGKEEVYNNGYKGRNLIKETKGHKTNSVASRIKHNKKCLNIVRMKEYL